MYGVQNLALHNIVIVRRINILLDMPVCPLTGAVFAALLNDLKDSKTPLW